MKGSHFQKNAACILLATIAAISLLGGADAGYTMQETCAYLQKGYIGDPTNCQNWGYCLNGELVKVDSCGTGLLFDSALGICNYAKDVVCQTTLSDICLNLADPGYVGDPNNCQSYGYCSNAQLQQSFSCPSFQIFNSDIEQCVWTSSGYTCPANSICRLVQNNQFVGDPVICGNYLRCQSGTGVSRSCGNGLQFNPMKSGCDPNYVCGSNPNNPNQPPDVPLTNTKICTNYVATGEAIQYFTDSTTCYGYYSCSSKTATGIWGSCPFATHFNGKECVTPYTYNCPYDRCGNLNLKFVAVINTECKEYSYCQNQVTVGQAQLCSSSNSEFPYFNEVGGGCVPNPITTQTICLT